MGEGGVRARNGHLSCIARPLSLLKLKRIAVLCSRLDTKSQSAVPPLATPSRHPIPPSPARSLHLDVDAQGSQERHEGCEVRVGRAGREAAARHEADLVGSGCGGGKGRAEGVRVWRGHQSSGKQVGYGNGPHQAGAATTAASRRARQGLGPTTNMQASTERAPIHYVKM